MKNRRRITAVAAVLAAALLMGGCADKELDASQVAATVGGEEITLGLANFAARLQQAEIETYYMAYLGTDMWNQEMGEDGQTYEESIKESVLESLRNSIVIRDHAEEYGVALTEEEETAIQEAAAQFISDNAGNEKGLARMTATEDVVAEMLTLMTIEEKMYYEIAAEANIEISDEEAAQKAADYVFIANSSHTNDDGESVEYTEEEKEELRSQLQDIVDSAQETGDFAAAAQEYDLEVSSATFGGDAVTALPDDVAAAADTLAVGEFTDIIDSGTAYYVAQLTSEFDQEATDARKDELKTEREMDYYDEKVAAWADEVEFTVYDDVWDQVTFASPLTIGTSSAEETEEDADEAGAEDAGEAEDAAAEEESAESQDEAAEPEADAGDGEEAAGPEEAADSEPAADAGEEETAGEAAEPEAAEDTQEGAEE